MDRRLAAILATDVVGYSRLMEKDEAGTLAALKARRKDLLEPLVARHKGRIFKVTGDGVLMEFSSAVNAVQCAVDFQAAMASANADMPDETRIVVRIGIHLGDVMVEGGDLYGDGVNIAARLETIAEPGGICVSEDAYRQVRNKLDCAFDDLGPQNLKNIAKPVQAYRIAAPRPERKDALPLPDKPSIAVLPFANMSRRSGAGVFFGRHYRGHHHRTEPVPVAVRDRPQFVLLLQGALGQGAGDGTRSRRRLYRRGQRPQGRQPDSASPPSSSKPRRAIISGPRNTTASSRTSSTCKTSWCGRSQPPFPAGSMRRPWSIRAANRPRI